MRVQKLGLLNGNYEDFTTDWYGTVGVTFVLIAIVDNATHYMSTLAKPLKLTIKRWFFSGEVSGRGGWLLLLCGCGACEAVGVCLLDVAGKSREPTRHEQAVRRRRIQSL